MLSAHRTPEAAAEFAKNAEGKRLCRDYRGSRHGGTPCGCNGGKHHPCPSSAFLSRAGAMDGMDALLATVQMPSGLPVATVALNGAKNAAVLAAQILAVSDARISAL